MASWEESFVHLREPFARNGLERLGEVLALLGSLDAAPGDADALASLARQFRYFAGAGTTFGFPEVTSIATRADYAIVELLQARSAPTPAHRDGWRSAVGELRAELTGDAAPMSLRRPSDGGPPSVAHGAPLRALVVHEDVAFARAVEAALVREEMEVVVATTKEAALALLAEGARDAIVTGMRFADGAGTELVEAVRAVDHGARTIVLLVGAETDFLDRVEAIECGADAFFEDDVDPEILARAVVDRAASGLRPASRILYVEDDEDQAAIMGGLLEASGYVVELCSDPARVGAALESFKPDLVLMDVQMPGANGYELVRYFRQDERYRALPVVFLTGGQARLESLRAGGDDHLDKPVLPPVLLSTVAARLERAAARNEFVRRDALTGLLNHASFSAAAGARIAKGPPAALVIFVVDKLAEINDHHGYQAGDAVLRSVASLLRRRLRLADLLARFSGAEIAVVLEGLDAQQALRLASRLLGELSSIARRSGSGESFSPSMSAGIAPLEAAMSLAQWVGSARGAVVEARRAGRNRAAIAQRFDAEPAPRKLGLVALGGGTGLSMLLGGLKSYVPPGRETRRGAHLASLSAIVTVTDDGGSSGRLRDELGVLPPGDIRNCLVALSEDEHLLAKLFRYRFAGTGNLQGHSFGNLFLTALTGVTGDFLQAITLVGEVLAIRGRIFPSTTTDTVLMAELASGEIVRGEVNVSSAGGPIRRVWLEPSAAPLPESTAAIAAADVLTLGPGSLYTSVIPNLLVGGIAEAIAGARALKIYVANLMTQPGETTGFSLEDHVAALYDAAPALALDVVLVNSGPIADKWLEEYASLGSHPLRAPEGASSLVVRGRRIAVLGADLVDETRGPRHSAKKIANAIFDVVLERAAAGGAPTGAPRDRTA